MSLRAPNLRTPSWRLVAGLSLLVVVPLAVLTRVGWHPLTSLDRRSDDSAHTVVLDHSWLLTATRWLTHLGDPAVVTLLAVISAVVMLVIGRRRAAVYLLLVRAVVGAARLRAQGRDPTSPTCARASGRACQRLLVPVRSCARVGRALRVDRRRR